MVVRELKIMDKEYPSRLRRIFNPPEKIYVIGNTEILENGGIAMVGCRQCSRYGVEVAQNIAYLLAKRNINIISGLARGIDTNAHLGALNANGPTIAVLGSGLDNIYPPGNIVLAKKIVNSGGAIITEYPLGTKAVPANFPSRNRIISGLSDAVIVVEAGRKSGTTITVDFALEQGKDVYAVPGNINQATSYGTNELIKQGAKPLTHIEDILEDISCNLS